MWLIYPEFIVYSTNTSMQFPFVVRTTQRPTACLLLWPPQASGRHRFNIRSQSFTPVFVPVHHDVMATRQQGDELRVMDICIGTFPFPRQPLFTLKALHIIHQYHPPGQALHTPNPYVEVLSSSTFAVLFTASQIQRDQIGKLYRHTAQHMN